MKNIYHFFSTIIIYSLIPLLLLMPPLYSNNQLAFANTHEEQENTPPFNNDNISDMMALPYLQGYFPIPDKTNVIKYNRKLAHKGYNLYTSGHKPAAFLIDMKGNILHQWGLSLLDVWPDDPKGGATPFWEDVYLYDNGDLLALYQEGGIIKIDKDSNLIWSYKCNAHHNVTVDNEGFIYTLTNDKLQLKENISILDNSILVLSPEGTLIKKTSLLLLMKNSKNPAVKYFFEGVIGNALNGLEDIFHTNTLEIFDGSVSKGSPIILKNGNALICMLTISTIAIIDIKLDEIVWILGPRLWYQGQHDPTLLDNGNILIFDNHLDGSKTQSRVMEFDPFTRAIEWEYKEDGFYSDTHGANQRLENGNTLIIETNTGRVFEVTKENKIVWEFLNPHTTGDNNELIAAIFAFYRIDPTHISSWLNNKQKR